jgi:type IV pilus assembly protein PilZ
MATRPSVLSLNISSKSALYAAYMPFIKNGACLFLPPGPTNWVTRFS